MLTVGNLLYASAYKMNSISMIMIGRALTGLGGPRGINRRYIADTTSPSQRTAISAAFVACSGLGQAVGPYLSVLLQVRKSEERERS